ncbi:phage integrase-related [Anaeramoeba flamelloides]|uniref:Phage integrase-related n=1 Tax=Anaeramoeba flamelloides TaxID=1746091 RepID=A0ABQ8YKK3_9EUKA|nr:phage integrase-related [Anaeramoeba flamelloides]
MFNGPQFYSFENQPYKNEFPNEVPMSDESLEQILKETLDEGIDVTENDQIKGEGNKVDLQNSKSELKISEEEKRVIDRSQKIHENKNSKKKNGEDFVFNSVRTYINQLFAFFSIYWLNHKLKDPPTLTNCPYSCNFFHIKLSELSEQGKTGSHRMGLTMEEEEKYDPYRIIKKYSKLVTPKRPPNSRFWSAVNINSQRKYWYKDQNIGRGHLAKIFKDRIKRAGIDKPNVTFHSIRATVVTNFVRNNINDKQGKTFTGHISDQSYNIYKSQDDIQSKNFSKTLLPRYPNEKEDHQKEKEKYQMKKKKKKTK